MIWCDSGPVLGPTNGQALLYHRPDPKGRFNQDTLAEYAAPRFSEEEPPLFRESVLNPATTDLGDRLGPFIFEYQRWGVKLPVILDRLDHLLEQLPSGPLYGVKVRNPTLLGRHYGEILRAHNVIHIHNRLTSNKVHIKLSAATGRTAIPGKPESRTKYDPSVAHLPVKPTPAAFMSHDAHGTMSTSFRSRADARSSRRQRRRPMAMLYRRTTSRVLGLLLLAPLIAIAAEAAPEKTEVTGEYRYTFHEPETPSDALTLACREAWRLAVIESPLYRDQTANVVDSVLLREVANNLVTKYVKDQQILEQFQRGKTVTCRVRGTLVVDESVKAIRTQLAGGSGTEDSLDQNRSLKLLAVREEANGTISVEYQALRRLDWLNTSYQGGLRETADIMVDFYDDQKFLIRTERYPARRNASGDDVMNPGATGVLRVPKPLAAKTYRVWLVK
ncbi:MAG: DUF72 domain-containing protein [Nitrospira sp.]|nr:DUF72 domain-containing protein [Nitrospira sp.]